MQTALDNQCGHCGEAIENAQDWHCPSCGKDFRVVGIVPKRPGEQWLIKLNEHRRTHGWRSVKEAICGQCAYPIRDRESFDCPECGGDARAVGVKVPGQMGRLIRHGSISTFGCFVSIVILFFTFILGVAIASWMAHKSQLALFTVVFVIATGAILFLLRAYRQGIQHAESPAKIDDMTK